MGTARGGRTPGRGVGAAFVLFLVTLAAPPLRAEMIELDLYEKVALAPLVVFGRVDGDPGRLADIRVLEVLKGDYSADHLQIYYRMINFERPYGQEKIAFENGEEALLFLVPAEKGRFILFKGPDGKFTLPAEGRKAWMDAARRLAQVAAIGDSVPLFDALRGLIREENPILVEIGLHQIRKHNLADESIVPRLLELVRQPEGGFCAEALELVAGMLIVPSDARPLSERDHLVGLASAIADGAPEAATRRAAVRLLASDGTPAARAKLESISERDPSQDVRYEAALAVYRLSHGVPFRFGTP